MTMTNWRVLYRDSAGDGKFSEIRAERPEEAAWKVAVSARGRGKEPELIRVENASPATPAEED